VLLFSKALIASFGGFRSKSIDRATKKTEQFSESSEGCFCFVSSKAKVSDQKRPWNSKAFFDFIVFR
jgi:hypothetical protein